jgi:hypothetical protein
VSSDRDFRTLLEKTRVVRFPRHRLSTFGLSEIRYSLATSVSLLPPLSTLRTGRVTAERPRILTPDALSGRVFRGFGADAEQYENWLRDHYSDTFRALEYTFRHELLETVPHRLDARELAENIRRDLDSRGVDRAAVICGPEKGWPFAVMKFILEETTQSYPENVRDLERRGLFDPAQAELDGRRREVESLFARARSDASLQTELGALLRRHRLFEDYQDRFFALVRGA